MPIHVNVERSLELNEREVEIMRHNSIKEEWWQFSRLTKSSRQSYLVLKGKSSCTCSINDTTYKARKGKISHIPAGVPDVNPYEIGLETSNLGHFNPSIDLISFYQYDYNIEERESVLLNKGAQPRLKQMKSMNILYRNTMVFVNILIDDK